MKKVDVGQATAILANIGVIAGIFFLGFELRQTRYSLQDNTHLQSVALISENSHLLFDSDFADTYGAALEEWSNLSDVQEQQVTTYVAERINVWEYTYYAYQRGTMDPELWEGWDSYFTSEINQSTWQIIWSEIEIGYGNTFRGHVNAIIDEG